jgi:ABC-type glycerol-3-phosphate transport system substrate-binding protein
MNWNGLKGVGLALLMSTTAASAADLTIFHSWSNESEMKALNVFVSKFESMGNKLTQLAVPHEQAGSSPIVSLIVAGTPPNIFLNGQADLYRDIRDRGMGQTVDGVFKENGAWDNFPQIVRDAITIDGDVRKIPTGIHIDGIIYYNMKVAAEAGVDPTKWTTADEMFADMDKVKAAGKNFIAVGGNTFQAGYLTHALIANVAGPEVFYRFYRGTPDKTVLDDPALHAAFEMFRKITGQADEGWVNRQWNESTNTVINGETLMQYHGDWMKGQWKANGKVLGTDFNCIIFPGSKALSVTVDAMGILGGDTVPPDQLAAEFEMAKIVTDPVNNAEFASYKGSTPVRVDAPTDRLDDCNKLVLSSLQKDGFSVQNPFYVGDADWISSVWTSMFTFQGDPNMSTEDLIELLKSEYDAVFG